MIRQLPLRLRRSPLGVVAVVLLGGMVCADAGDILRGGASAGAAASRRNPADGSAGAGAAAAAATRANAKDRLSRTTQALQSVRQMQAAARAAAESRKGNNLGRNPNARTLPVFNGLNGQLIQNRLKNVPNGMRPNGLKIDPRVPKDLRRPEEGENPDLWIGAKLPTERKTKGGGSEVTIKQTDAQALLTWRTFNVGRKTTVHFDQSAGGDNATQWIAFNRITDPSGAPSQILGSIKAAGQVYVINQNGIIFGGTSQVNVHTLVASSLPINTGLVERGLLNNADAQFLFSSLPLPSGSKGASSFEPPRALTPDGNPGDVEVRAGATIVSPTSAEGVGGRVMLVGANVENAGTISTEDGQTILAAGLQVGIAGHAASDPTLRGLDVFVGAVENPGTGLGGTPAFGSVTNSGLIEARRASVTMVGREVSQLGAIESSTSVSFNGRIDLLASYNAISNPAFNPAAVATGVPFLARSTGTVRFGPDSVTRILPELTSDEVRIGAELSLRSQVNVLGQAVQFARGSALLAPSAEVRVDAGTWDFIPSDTAPRTQFIYFGGRIQFEPGALLDVAGTTDVFVPQSQTILDVELRGSELADSPLQRLTPEEGGLIRGETLRIDTRNTGIYDGRFWVGTPLGDAAGFLGLIERNVGQLTVPGGTVSLNAGDTVVMERGSIVDASGGWVRHEGGFVRTTRLVAAGRLIDIADATPDRIYDGYYADTTTDVNMKYGIVETYRRPLTFAGGYFEEGYVEGAPGGKIAIAAPTMALDGKLTGRTVTGPRQLRDAKNRTLPPDAASLELVFRSEDPTVYQGIDNPPISPAPPRVIFADMVAKRPADPFAVDANGKPLVLTRDGTPFLLDPDENPFIETDETSQLSLREDRREVVYLSPTLLSEDNFGSLTVDNRDGNVIIARGSAINGPSGGSLTLAGSNIEVRSDVTVPGGTLKFTAYNQSTYDIAILLADRTLPNTELPDADPDRGNFLLGRGTTISAAGLIVDDRFFVEERRSVPMQLDGGEVTVESFTAMLQPGSLIDVSGGVAADREANLEYGDGGSIAIRTGRDPNLTALVGGGVRLRGELAGFSGARGGSLELQSQLVRVGGDARGGRLGVLAIEPEFFNRGGFGSFELAGTGANATFEIGPFGTYSLDDFERARDPDKPEVYRPGLIIAEGTEITPLALNYQAFAYGDEPIRLQRQLDRKSDRTPVSLSFRARGATDPFTNVIEVRGDLIMQGDTSIVTDPEASVAFAGQTVLLRGSVYAPGGSISVSGSSRFPSAELDPLAALTTVYIAPTARLSTAGTAVRTFDVLGRRTGYVLPGGTIEVSGNVVAAAGSVMDVSGATGLIEVPPAVLGLNALLQPGLIDGPLIPLTSGLNSPLYSQQFVPVQVDSDGGSITFEGGEQLFVDSTLRGRAGGPTALGGSISVSSGRYYPDQQIIRPPSDVTLTVTQGDPSLPTFAENARWSPRVFLKSDALQVIGNPARDGNGNQREARGYFSADQFLEGGFDSLELNGVVEFSGPVDIRARQTLSVASGGFLTADDVVNLAARYVEIGTPFVPPLRPDDSALISIFQTLNGAFYAPPTKGSGRLTVRGTLIDVGNLSLQNIRRATFIAEGGDIRGNGTLSIAGLLTLRASQIYPTTGGRFNVFAYDFAERASEYLPLESLVPDGQPRLPLPTIMVTKRGSVTIEGAGVSQLPLSAGGQIGIYASIIEQRGTLRAPIGSITLGWDGLGEAPFDVLAGGTLPVTPTQRLVLGAGSLTSTSAIDPITGEGILIPFGLNVNETAYFTPAGVDITAGGVPGQSIRLGAAKLATQRGSTIDVQGGGDLFAYRWVAGLGGSVDLLGSPASEWSAGATYEAGDLVSFDGVTYSARVDTPDTRQPTARLSGRGVAVDTSRDEPTTGLFWNRVDERFAIVPGYEPSYAPYAPFNGGSEASSALGNDPGYVSRTLQVGDRIYLGASSALPAGDYTLLPARYGILPGAAVVRAVEVDPRLVTLANPDGSRLVSGYRYNSLNQERTVPRIFSAFEVLGPDVLASRAEYELYSANRFLSNQARRLEADIPRLPMDAGRLVFRGIEALNIRGALLGRGAEGGRGARVDISTPLNVVITGPRVTVENAELPPDFFGVGTFGDPTSGVARIRTSLLNSWGAESLLIGGERIVGANGTVVRTETGFITVDNAGLALTGPEIILSANRGVILTPRSAVVQEGNLLADAERLLLRGDGALLRVTSDFGAETVRTGATGAIGPVLTLSRGSLVSGTSVTLDSTDAMAVARRAMIDGDALSLSAGQITIALRESGKIGSTRGLVLQGPVRRDVASARSLSLLSYSTIDVYGHGLFRGRETLSLNAAEIRGFNIADEKVIFRAGNLVLGNSAGSVAPEVDPAAEVPELAGSLVFRAKRVELGENALGLRNYADVAMTARQRLRFSGEGSLTVDGDLLVTTPLVVAGRSATQSVTAGGAVQILAPESGGTSTLGGGLGANLTVLGTSVEATSNIHLPSGLLTLRASEGDVSVGGVLDVSGRERRVLDVVRFTDGGNVALIADAGSVRLAEGSLVNVSAQPRAGNAGRLDVRAGDGEFLAEGELLGSAGPRGRSGSFSLDVGTLEDLGALDALLNEASFNALRLYRVRAGDVVVSGDVMAADYRVSADGGSIRVTGTVDASGRTGGSIALSASGSLVLTDGARLNARGDRFDSAGKGGAIYLAAGSHADGVIDETATLDLQEGSRIDLGVARRTENSESRRGWFTGTLHLRAPRSAANDEIQIATIGGEIRGASSIIAEGYRLYDLTGSSGEITTALRTAIQTQGNAFLGAAGAESAAYGVMLDRLIGADSPLSEVFTLRPGVEIINRDGDLRLGTPSGPLTNDWNLATLRFGPRRAPGVLTMRASEDILLFNSISDGFFTTAFNSFLLQRSETLPANAQSWSYRFTAGADLAAADFRRVRALSELEGEDGTLILGRSSGTGASSRPGANALTRTTVPAWFQVIRTGSGDIDISAGRDIQFRNIISSIYTVGTEVEDPTLGGEFDIPFLNAQGGQFVLGAVQQVPGSPVRYTAGGGNVTLSAQRDLARYRALSGGVLAPDSGRQLPMTWLYRRAFVDPVTGEFGGTVWNTADRSDIGSTTWWVDFTNFFQGVGALGGGNVSMTAGRDVANVDAVAPTNARMLKGVPDASRLVELGGGDVTVRAGRNIDGGVYYVERGVGTLDAGSTIKTNATRSPSLVTLTTQAPFPEQTWLPTTLFLGKGTFNVQARGDVLLGPVANVFLLPGGYNNTYWYKTYFSTYAPDSAVNVTSLGGSVTLRNAVSLPTIGQGGQTGTLQAWLNNVLAFNAQRQTASLFQPWLRLNESSVSSFAGVSQLLPGTLRVAAYSGDINVVGNLTLSPSPSGTLELLAGGAVNGLNPQGVTTVSGVPTVAWGSGRINVSDADPARIPGIATPFAFQTIVGTAAGARTSGVDFLNFIDQQIEETGVPDLPLQLKQALHADGPLHVDDFEPLRIYAAGGDISGLTLFSPKAARVIANRDIRDVAFYIQNLREDDVTVISAGRDIIPFDQNSPLRASSVASGNLPNFGEVALAGDIQIAGPGVVEVLAGRNIDLGTGPNNPDGTGVGLTTVGNTRNSGLPFQGASIVAAAGLRETALGLSGSRLNFDAFIEEILLGGGADAGAGVVPGVDVSPGSGTDGTDSILDDLAGLSEDRRNQVALDLFYGLLRDVGRAASDPDSPTFANYDLAYEAIATLFDRNYRGELLTRARDIRTRAGGNISILTPGGGLTLSRTRLGETLVPPGIVTEVGGNISIFANDSVDIGIGRIFTLRGGNQIIWSSTGDIAAGSAAKTVASAPPTRVVLDPTSADVKTDLAGLATGGGIGVLATVEGVEPGDVDLIAPVGVVDAGDAGIRVTGNLNIAAVEVRNASNIAVAGSSTAPAPAAVSVSAPSIGAITSAASTAGAATSTAEDFAAQQDAVGEQEAAPSIFTVEVVGYGGGTSGESRDEEEDEEDDEG